MPAPLDATAVVRRLTAELNVLPADLGLADASALAGRAQVWVEVAAEREGSTAAQQYQQVKALCLRSWMTRLSRKADEFEATGDMKTKSDMLGRIGELRADEAVALRAAGLPVPGEVPAVSFVPLAGIRVGGSGEPSFQRSEGTEP